MRDNKRNIQPSARLLWLDAVKGAGMILVMLSHLPRIPKAGPYLFACFMPLFFISSGYTSSRSFETKAYIQKKSKRLLIPYVVYGSFLLLVKMRKTVFRGNVREAVLDLVGFFYSRYYFYAVDGRKNLYFLTSGNSTHWFLTAFFVGTVLAIPLLKKTCATWLAVGYLVLTILLNELPVLLPWSLDMGGFIAVFIWIGACMKKHGFGDFTKRTYILFALLGSVLYIGLVSVNPGINMSVRRYGQKGAAGVLLFLLIGVLGTVTVMSLFRLIEHTKVTDFLAAVGRISLTIMCLHKFFFSIFEKTFGRLICEGYVNDYLKVAASILFSYLLARGYRILEDKYHWTIFQYL